MPRFPLLICFAITGIGLFLTALHAQAAVILSEVEVSGDKAADEFVELYNTGDESVHLKDYSLRRKSAGDVTVKGSSLKTFGSGDTIPSHGYFLWASSSGIFKDYADATTTGGLSDNNSLGLLDKNGNLIDALTWGNGHTLPFAPTSFDNPEKQEGFERDIDTLSWSKTKNITPTNSQGETWQEIVPPPPEPKPLKQVVINEVFPNPKAKSDQGEFIELYNPLTEAVDLSQWEIYDASTSGKYIFPSGKKIESLGYLVITDKDFTFSLNNTNETLTLFDTVKRTVHSVHYEKTKEDVTLNLVGSALKGGKIPTPGKENILNTDPLTKERTPKKGYRDIPVEFSAVGKDSDGDSLKYTWDFGDGHKSYKRAATHTYKETGKYTVLLTTDDGIGTITETFEVKIEKYEAPKLRIVAIMPNPKGKDSDFEWIEIENREKKSVDLRGFSIATGSKARKLTNHPIRDSFEIKGQSTKRLTRDDSLFTLNNKKGYIELRDPTGEMIHRFKYKFERGIREDIVLQKAKGQELTLVSTKDAPSEISTSLSSETTLDPEPMPTLPPETTPATPETLPPMVQGVSTTYSESPEDIQILPLSNHFIQQWQKVWQSLFTWFQKEDEE